MNPNLIDLHKELKKYFGFNQFKGLQEQVIKSIVAQKNTFVIMPTGGGKSLCYQLPALIQEGTAIVVSPLIALMKNQVDAIRSVSTNDGIAHVLNSSLTKTEINQVNPIPIVNGPPNSRQHEWPCVTSNARPFLVPELQIPPSLLERRPD